MARERKAYMIGISITEFMNQVHDDCVRSVDSFLDEVQKYVKLLLTGEKELLIFMLMHELYNSSYAVDLLEMVYDF